MNDELKPCPFCGEIPKVIRYTPSIIKSKTLFYIKHACGDGSKIWVQTAFKKTEKELVAVWNNRATN
jgi:Lar family restriction alleviation protein